MGNKIVIETRDDYFTLLALHVEIYAFPLPHTWTTDVAQNHSSSVSWGLQYNFRFYGSLNIFTSRRYHKSGLDIL
jgi:hypothetical protein